MAEGVPMQLAEASQEGKLITQSGASRAQKRRRSIHCSAVFV